MSDLDLIALWISNIDRKEGSVLVWTHSGSKPNLREERTFTLESIIVQEFKASIDQQQSFGFWVSIDNARCSNRVITETELKDYR